MKNSGELVRPLPNRDLLALLAGAVLYVGAGYLLLIACAFASMIDPEEKLDWMQCASEILHRMYGPHGTDTGMWLVTLAFGCGVALCVRALWLATCGRLWPWTIRRTSKSLLLMVLLVALAASLSNVCPALSIIPVVVLLALMLTLGFWPVGLLYIASVQRFLLPSRKKEEPRPEL